MINISLTFIFGLFFYHSSQAEVCDNKMIIENKKLLNKISEYQYEDFKKCYLDLAKFADVPITNVPGVAGSAIPLLCSGPSFKTSTAFTKEQLDAGVPILADTKNVYVYLTDTGYKFVEFPVFYTVVKYTNGSAGYDIGMLPKNYMPIQSADGKFRLVTGSGEVITIENPKAKPLDPRVNYSDKYIKLFPEHELGSISIKDTSHELTSERAHDCLFDNAMVLMNRVSQRKVDLKYSFQFAGDTKNALLYKQNDPIKLNALKEKYKRTKDEMFDLYIETLKKTIPACSNTFTEENFKSQADHALKDFLIDYERERQFIINISPGT